MWCGGSGGGGGSSSVLSLWLLLRNINRFCELT